MRIYKIKHRGRNVIRAFRNGVKIWNSDRRILVALERLCVTANAEMDARQSSALEETFETSVEMEGVAATPESVNSVMSTSVDIDTYADLLAYQVAQCVSDTPITLKSQAEAYAPDAATVCAENIGSILANAYAKALPSTVIDAEIMHDASAEAEASAQPATPLEVCFVWDFLLTADAELTVSTAADIAADGAVCVDHEASADREITRYYTVRFFDGDTVLSEQQIGHGETATPPDTTKDGYLFTGWAPDPDGLAIVEDTDFYGAWTQKSDDIMPRQTIVFDNSDTDKLTADGKNPYYYIYKPEKNITKGETYKVEWDGTVYSCAAERKKYVFTYPGLEGQSTYYEPAMGNAHICYQIQLAEFAAQSVEQKTKEPFFMRATRDSLIIYIADAGTHTVRIYQ